MKVGTILGIIVGILLVPFAGIWALNTLFPVLSIGYSWETWLATFLLSGAIFGRTYN